MRFTVRLGTTQVNYVVSEQTTGPTGFYWALVYFAGLYWSVRGKTGLYRAVLDSLLGCTRCKRVIQVIEVIQVFQVIRVVK